MNESDDAFFPVPRHAHPWPTTDWRMIATAANADATAAGAMEDFCRIYEPPILA